MAIYNKLHLSMLKSIPRYNSTLKDFRCIAVVKHNHSKTLLKNNTLHHRQANL